MGRRTIRWKRRLRTVTAVPAPTFTSTSSSVTLSWTALRGAARYDLQRLDQDGVTWSTIFTSPTALTFTDTGLVNAATYTYRLAVVTVSGGTKVSAFVNALTLNVTAPPPTPEFGPVITDTGPTSIAGEVPAVAGATRYVIQHLVLDQ